MLDHISFGVTDHARTVRFYDLALKPLGITRLFEVPPEHTDGVKVSGYGTQRPRFWIAEERPVRGLFHVAFEAASRAEVDAFYEAALAAGGTDNGAPGLRPHYHDAYYGAFVRDPDGHNIEAVCHHPE